MEMTAEERRIQEAAIEFARKNKKQRCIALTDTNVFLPEEHPVSVFMAGSPGAGKTESSKELIVELESRTPGSKVLRIDPDDLRSEFPGYDGKNSWLFQGAASIWVDRMLDLAFSQNQSFILDGTLSDHDRAKRNIERCLRHGRAVQILYVYQDPLLAWQFVQAREAEEGRRIYPPRFIEIYFRAREVVNALKAEFGPKISVDLLFKPNDSTPKLSRVGIDKIDYHVPEKYRREELVRLLLVQT
jgi:UDP-N-acetylglucosamine kinase